MGFHSFEDIKWIEFDNLITFPIQHGIFTRHGGVSPEPWSSLNIGGTVGDSIQNTRENKKRLLHSVDIPYDTVYDVWQVHSADYILATKPRGMDEEHLKADIIISNTPGLTLLMRFADCVPIMAYDPIHHAVGMAHAGWIGTSKDVAGELIRSMQKEFGSIPGDIISAIGPSICQKHYPVGEDVVDLFRKLHPQWEQEIFYKDHEQSHLDLWKANQLLLEQAGVKNLELAGLCTVCQNQDWYSHRKERGRTGRFGALIRLSKREED